MSDLTPAEKGKATRERRKLERRRLYQAVDLLRDVLLHTETEVTSEDYDGYLRLRSKRYPEVYLDIGYYSGDWAEVNGKRQWVNGPLEFNDPTTGG